MKFHSIGKEVSTRWAGGLDLSMLAEAGNLDPGDETGEYERVVDPKYLDQIRTEAKQFFTKLSNMLGTRRKGRRLAAVLSSFQKRCPRLILRRRIWR